MASATPAVGTISTPAAAFSVAGANSETVTFAPVSGGTTNISLTQPAGFSTPTTGQQITVTVTAPPINAGGTTMTTGLNLEVSNYVYLSQTPPNPTLVTVTSANPAVAVVSLSPTVAGGTSVTYPNTVGTSGLTFYVQGLGIGTTTVTASAPAYTSVVINVTVDPSGFILATGNFSTTTFSTPTNAQLPRIRQASLPAL